MSGREAAMWDDLRRQLLAADPMAHLTRIENAASLGTPDVNGCWHGVDFWCELKCLEKFPKDPLAVVTIRHYTRDQQLWLRKRGMAGGRAFLLLKVLMPVNEWFLFSWQTAYKYVGRVPADDLRSRALVYCPTKQLDCEALRFALLTPPERTPP